MTTTGDDEIMKSVDGGMLPISDGDRLPSSLPKPRSILDRIQADAIPELN